MEIKILKDEKDCLDVEISNLTMVEVLRAYLIDNGAKIAAWKRINPQENPVLHIEGDSPRKLLTNTIEKISKEIDSIVDEFKKLK